MYLFEKKLYKTGFEFHPLARDQVLSSIDESRLWKKKILKRVEYESARRKRHVNEKTRKRDEEGSTFLLCTFIKGTQGNSKKLMGTQGNSRKLI